MNGYVKYAVQEPPQAEINGVKNTGFPEPLNADRNTTLPHPSADTSPSASIESTDVPITRTHSRHSSFQLPRIGTHKQKSKTPASGFITDDQGLYDNIQYADGSKEAKGIEELTKKNSADRKINTAVVDGGNLSGVKAPETENQRLERVDRERDEQGHGEGHERKKGVLRKLPLHKV